MNTSLEFQSVLQECRSLYEKKMKDYGSAWRIMRAPSMTDQIFIKATRIRNIQISGSQCVDEDIRSEYVGIFNYSIMALIQLELGYDSKLELEHKEALRLYDKYAQNAYDLMLKKNHDYGEAWREMRDCSFVDIILQKLLRVKQIEGNQGQTLVSEGIDANYYDMINYAAFALMKM